MTIEANLITGLMLGMEYVHSSAVEGEDEDYHMIVVDLLFLRFIISF